MYYFPLKKVEVICKTWRVHWVEGLGEGAIFFHINREESP